MQKLNRVYIESNQVTRYRCTQLQLDTKVVRVRSCYRRVDRRSCLTYPLTCALFTTDSLMAFWMLDMWYPVRSEPKYNRESSYNGFHNTIQRALTPADLLLERQLLRFRRKNVPIRWMNTIRIVSRLKSTQSTNRLASQIEASSPSKIMLGSTFRPPHLQISFPRFRCSRVRAQEAAPQRGNRAFDRGRGKDRIRE